MENSLNKFIFRKFIRIRKLYKNLLNRKKKWIFNFIFLYIRSHKGQTNLFNLILKNYNIQIKTTTYINSYF